MVCMRRSNPSPLVSSLFILHLLTAIATSSPSSPPRISNVQENTNPPYQAPSSGLDELDHDTPPTDWMIDHLSSVDPNVQVHIITPDTTGDNLLLRPLPPRSPSPSIHTPDHTPHSHGSNDSPIESSPPNWHSVSTKPPRPVRPLSLRHNPTMDWGMRARARNQIYWDKYWVQLEASRHDDNIILNEYDAKEKDAKTSSKPNDGDSDDGRNSAGDQDSTKHSTSCSPPTHLLSTDTNSTDSASNNVCRDGTIPNSANGANSTTSFTGESGYESEGTGGSRSHTPTSEDDDAGYFYFHQILNHFQDPTSTPGSESIGRPSQETFRQYYHVSAEFYKPGKG